MPFLLICLILIPSQAFPWGQATHAYFAKELGQGSLNEQEIYGAAVPDLFNLRIESAGYDFFLAQTHRHLTQLKKEARKRGLHAFAFGFVSHNDRWGADEKAHGNRKNRPSYVLAKARLLAGQLRPPVQALLEEAGVPLAFLWANQVSDELSHSLVEMAIDLMIKRNEDPAIGLDLFQSAQGRPASVPDLVAASYGRSFAHHMGIPQEEADEFIRQAETEFQRLMMDYGESLMQEESEACRRLADQGAGVVRELLESATGKAVPVSSEFIAEGLARAIDQVERDYGPELASTLSSLKHHRALSAYLKRVLRRMEGPRYN